MKITSVTYSKKFPYAPYLNIDIGFEATLDSDGYDNPIHAIKQLEALAEQYYNEKYPHLYQETTPTEFNSYIGLQVHGSNKSNEGYPISTPEPEEKLSPQQQIINQINLCSSIEVLKTFELLAKNNPTIQEAYDKRLNELTK